MKKTTPLVSIIIVNWNGKHHLIPCLSSLNKITYKNVEIIIVDNNSTDGSQAAVKSRSKKNIVLVQNSDNKGFAEANNIGFKYAKGKYVLFLNNDTIVDRDFLEPLVTQLETNRMTAGNQPKILQHPNTKLVDSIGSYFVFSGFLYHIGHNKPDRAKNNTRLPVFTMKGACMLFRKSVLDKVGVFDPDYFAYFEETDLCQRIWLAGYELWYEPDSIIYHKGGQTSRFIATDYITFHSYKNRILTYLKNCEGTTLWAVMPFHYALCEVIAFIYLLTAKPGLFLSVQKALFWPLFNIKSIRSKRRVVQRLRKKTDNGYLPTVTRSVRPDYYFHLYSSSLKGYID